VPEGKVYAEELCELIKIWRRDLRDVDLPFVIVQIADYDERDDKGWHLVQEGQLRAEKMLPNVKTVISRDISESFHIHPPTKTEISKRIANALCEF
jgi:sialate O-acetylesterase